MMSVANRDSDGWVGWAPGGAHLVGARRGPSGAWAFDRLAP